MQNPYIYNTKLSLIRPENTYYGALCYCMLGETAGYEELIASLHPNELKHYHTLRFERRIRSYLLGRFVAKNAVATLTHETGLPKIEIRSGIFTQPLVISDMANIQVSITHSDDVGAALAYPEAHPMGIDIEKIDPQNKETLERPTTEAEKTLIRNTASGYSYETLLTLLWTAKEALSKVLKTGLMTPFEIFEISKLEIKNNHILSWYKNFAQYKVISFQIGDYICSITYPLKTELQFDMDSLQKSFQQIETA